MWSFASAVKAAGPGTRGPRATLWAAGAAVAAAFGCGRPAPPPARPPEPALPPLVLPADYQSFRTDRMAFRPTGDRTLDYWAEVNLRVLTVTHVIAARREGRSHLYTLLARGVRDTPGDGVDADVQAWAARVAAGADALAAGSDPGADIAAKTRDVAAADGGRPATDGRRRARERREQGRPRLGGPPGRGAAAPTDPRRPVPETVPGLSALSRPQLPAVTSSHGR